MTNSNPPPSSRMALRGERFDGLWPTRPESPTGRTPTLLTVISHAVEKARRQGLDEARQYDRAVRAIMRVEPSLTLLSAARLVNAHLETLDPLGLLARYTSAVARGGALNDDSPPS